MRMELMAESRRGGAGEDGGFPRVCKGTRGDTGNQGAGKPVMLPVPLRILSPIRLSLRLNRSLTERQEIQSVSDHQLFVETRLAEFLIAEPPTFPSISVS